MTSAVRKQNTRMISNTYLLVQRMGTSHRVQLTGLDKFLTHQTQLTGGWSLWDKKAGHCQPPGYLACYAHDSIR